MMKFYFYTILTAAIVYLLLFMYPIPVAAILAILGVVADAKTTIKTKTRIDTYGVYQPTGPFLLWPYGIYNCSVYDVLYTHEQAHWVTVPIRALAQRTTLLWLVLAGLHPLLAVPITLAISFILLNIEELVADLWMIKKHGYKNSFDRIALLYKEVGRSTHNSGAIYRKLLFPKMEEWACQEKNTLC